jgi:hypothetical protein
VAAVLIATTEASALGTLSELLAAPDRERWLEERLLP